METWVPVPGFNDYEVSQGGVIRRAVKGRWPAGKVLRPGSQTNGYQVVMLWRDRRQHARRVHSVVAEAFLGPRPEGHDVNHRDCDRTNNAASNLEYLTRAENCRHSALADRLGNKLENADIKEIRQLVASGRTQESVGRMFGVTQAIVSKIARRQLWKHVE